MRIKRYAYTGHLGWSFSRYQMFDRCKRQYYYHYYGSRYDREGDRIAALKRLTSVPLQVGTVLHEGFSTVLRRLLKDSSPLQPDNVLAWLRHKTGEAFENAVFLEQFYFGQLVHENDVWDTVRQGMVNFLQSSRLAELHAEAASGGAKWLIEPSGYGEMRINDLKAYCKADFIRATPTGYVVFDWKSGKPNLERDALQLTGYAHYVGCHYGAPVDSVSCVGAYVLPDYREVTVDRMDSAEFGALVDRQTREMDAYCVDIDQNEPMGKEAFARTDNKGACRYCNYQALCP